MCEHVGNDLRDVNMCSTIIIKTKMKMFATLL